MDFKDHFSAQAKEYSKYRPKYPEELFLYLNSLVKEHNTAWDCATGNGQAAIGLVPYFDKIIATDASSSQIEHAVPHPKIEYRRATAEKSGLDADSVDLLTVATALHWFNSDLFYPEVKRIVKNDGVIAVWTYSEAMINEEIDKVSEHYTHNIVGNYWAPEIKRAWDFENQIILPFNRIETPEFEFLLHWDLNDYINFLYTWSATQSYIRETGLDPVKFAFNDCLDAWKEKGIKRDVKLKLILKAARISK